VLLLTLLIVVGKTVPTLLLSFVVPRRRDSSSWRPGSARSASSAHRRQAGMSLDLLMPTSTPHPAAAVLRS
jgi:hypothetical protein